MRLLRYSFIASTNMPAQNMLTKNFENIWEDTKHPRRKEEIIVADSKIYAQLLFNVQYWYQTEEKDTDIVSAFRNSLER